MIDIGWRLEKKYWGQGYATEAARYVLNTGLGSLGFDRLVSFTTKCNLPSTNVMRKIGMYQANTGFEHPHIKAGNPLREHIVFQLSQRDWQRNNEKVPT